VYQGPNWDLFCRRPRPRPSRGLKTGEDKRHFFAEVHIKFLQERTNYKAKDMIGKITNIFCIYFFQIDKFINTYSMSPD
jgi:hypothetical protein